MGEIDYSKYSLVELYEVEKSIDKDKFPERYQSLLLAIKKHQSLEGVDRKTLNDTIEAHIKGGKISFLPNNKRYNFALYVCVFMFLMGMYIVQNIFLGDASLLETQSSKSKGLIVVGPILAILSLSMLLVVYQKLKYSVDHYFRINNGDVKWHFEQQSVEIDWLEVDLISIFEYQHCKHLSFEAKTKFGWKLLGKVNLSLFEIDEPLLHGILQFQADKYSIELEITT